MLGYIKNAFTAAKGLITNPWASEAINGFDMDNAERHNYARDYEKKITSIIDSLSNNTFIASSINEDEQIRREISRLPHLAANFLEYAIKFNNMDALKAILAIEDSVLYDGRHSSELRLQFAAQTAAFHRNFEMLDTIMRFHADAAIAMDRYEIIVPKDSQELQQLQEAHLKRFERQHIEPDGQNVGAKEVRMLTMQDFLNRVPFMVRDEDECKKYNSQIAAIQYISNTLYIDGVVELQHKITDFLIIKHPTKPRDINYELYMQMGKTFLIHTIDLINADKLEVHDLVKDFLLSEPIRAALAPSPDANSMPR